MKRLRLALTALVAAACLAAAPAAAPMTGMVHTADVDLAYFVFGAPSDAVPVIAVNGGPGLSHVYMLQNDVWPRIAAHREVVLYDQRGDGASTRVRNGAPQTMAAQVADLDAVRAKLGFATFDLVGDSYGGMIAMAYAEAHPERVHKLVLSDSAAPNWKAIDHLFPDVFPDLEQKFAASEKRAPNAAAAAQLSLRDHFMMIFYSEAKRDAYLAGAKDLGFTPAVGEAVFRATSAIDLTPKLASIAAPTLVITGRYDMNVAPLTAWKIAHAIPHARFVPFERSGHLPSYEEPDRYVAVLDAFFNDR
jgi:proline iminopeptidase